MKPGVTIITLLGCILPMALQAAELYRWYDERGRLHYSDVVPADTPYERIEPADTAEEASADLAGTESASISAVSPAEAQSSGDGLFGGGSAIALIRPATCEDARLLLQVLHEPVALYRTADGQVRTTGRGDDYRGTRSYLSDAERADFIESARNAVLRLCGDPATF